MLHDTAINEKVEVISGVHKPLWVSKLNLDKEGEGAYLVRNLIKIRGVYA